MYTQDAQPRSYSFRPQEQQDFQQNYQQGYQFLSGMDSNNYMVGTHSQGAAHASSVSESYRPYLQYNQPYGLPPDLQSSMNKKGLSASNTASMGGTTLGGETISGGMLSLSQIDTRQSESRASRRKGAAAKRTGEGSSGAGRGSRGRSDEGKPSSRPIPSHESDDDDDDDNDEDDQDEDDEDDPSETRQPQTAPGRQARKQAIAAILNLPSTVELTFTTEQEKSILRKWVAQEWKRRGMNVGMEAQDLAKQVTQIKILHRGIAMGVGKICHTMVKRDRWEDLWYQYDYFHWADTYQQRVKSLEKTYALQGLTDDGEIQHRLMHEFYIARPKHYAKLADADAEVAEIAIAQTIWSEFLATQLQERLFQGEPFTTELIAQQSWYWNAKRYTLPVTLKYLYKFLRCVSEWRPDQIEHLKMLQEASKLLADSKSPMPRARRGRPRINP